VTSEKIAEAGTSPQDQDEPAPRALVAQARALRNGISAVAAAPPDQRRAARAAYEAARDDMVYRQLAELPLARLKETTQGRLRLGAIEDAGYRTVGQAAAAGVTRLQQIPGVGPQTATQVVAAARQLGSAMMQRVRLRFDPDARPPLQARLLAELYRYAVARQAASPGRENLDDVAAALDAVLTGSRRAVSRLRMLFSGSRKRDEARSALSQLEDLMGSVRQSGLDTRLQQSLADLAAETPDEAALWRDYEERAVFYNGLLIEIGELEPDIEAGQGFIPADIARRIQNQPLDLSLMRASLRGYQQFGAKFALCQGKAMLGDEMGLGKSVEALAAMCHLQVEGHRHFLVVCPASVLVNWTHEIGRHSELRSYRLHGSDRQRNLQVWARVGGVAVTTYESLRSLSRPAEVNLGMLVVDEAHYVKNLAAERTKAVRQWAATTSRVLFLTGTPMENRVEEFRVLVSHLQPGLVPRISSVDGMIGAGHFRAAVAPVYLRRNQDDVLQELPPRVETEEWVELTASDLRAYRNAVAEGNFMAMRRAAYVPGTPAASAKLGRLVEIVEEASANDRKVVVFSYFRDVLDTVAAVLGNVALGPLTGSTPPIQRQAMVDEFEARRSPRVLVSQIQAGGVGLNIQAASVVILTEPQWKPTIEDQAIARSHRMGQVRSVDVHRLLAEDTVDQRMLEILATKATLFDEYVRRSELKDHSPDAVDISDLKAADEVGSQVEAERRIIELERKRLRMEAEREL
jgi:SNF2-related domain/Helicase conserved C-terminal domain/Helix-hairpin-helix domain